MTRRIALLAAAAVVAGGTAGIAGGTNAGPAEGLSLAPSTTPTLRLDGIGPLRLGMTRAAGLRTGWLARRGKGCELGGPPIPITYRLTGPSAEPGIRAIAEFDDGALENVSATRGVRTATGVIPGVTTARGMVNRYRAAGFAARAQFVDVFGGTFVTVRRRGREVIGGFARGRVAARRPLAVIGVPFVPTCE